MIDQKQQHEREPTNGVAVRVAAASAKHQIPGGAQDIDADGIRNTLVMFLRELDTPFPSLQYEPHFAQDACMEALKLGFSSSYVYSPEFQQAVQPSAAMCMTVYPHLPLSSQYYICLYTTCAIYFDDLALRDASVVKEFNALFFGNRKQHHPLLDAFAILLRTTSEHFSDICAAMIITSTLDYISALIVEQEQQDTVVHTAAANYPSYLRYLTGVARPYSLFLFPPNIPLQTYIQVLPDMIHYFEDVNDIFSFYKEELAGETSNHISLISRVRGCDKMEAMKHLAQVSIDGARRITSVLEHDPMACFIARKYLVQGYIGFHALSRQRYRLDDLCLDYQK